MKATRQLRTVLIVDDDPNTHKIVDYMLSDIADEFIHAYNGKHAMHQLEKLSVDCIILDMHLKDDLGIRFLRAMKDNETFSDIPVIMISVDSGCNRVASAYDFGAFGYIPKPLNQIILQAKVRSAFRERTLLNQLRMH